MGAGTVTLGLFAAAYFGSMLLGPAYVQLVRGDSATLAGAIGVLQALTTGISLQVATRLVDRVEPRLVVGVGIAVALLGTVLGVIVLDADTPYPLLSGLACLPGWGSVRR
jgi:MFS family permease